MRDIAVVEHCAQGRHRSLFHAAANAGELVAGGELDEETAALALEATGRRVGLLESDIRRTVRDGMERGRRSPRRAPRDGFAIRDRTDARARIVRWYEHAVGQGDWSARTSGTTLKILAGFCLLATRAGKVRITQSYREVAEAAGVSVGTVSKHERHWRRYVAVVQKGSRSGRALVERADGSRTNRSVFQLLVPGDLALGAGNTPEASVTAEADLFPGCGAAGGGAAPTPVVPGSVGLADPALDVWHRAGARWRVWSLLDDREPALLADLARWTGRSTRWVGRTVHDLVEAGLATACGDGGFCRLDASAEVGGRERLRSRRARHQAERVVFAGYLEARFGARATDPPVEAAGR